MAKYFSSKSFNVVDREDMFTQPNEEDYKLIREYLNGDIPIEELFVYPVLLCDNNEDRDNEKFDHEALVEIADKFKGVTGIHDHEHLSDNQHSITYKTELIKDEEKLNSVGEAYEYVIGYQYMLNNERNKNLIADIKAGIKNGVSIGFQYGSCKCSICHVDWKINKCEHEKGHSYDNSKCMGILSNITDIYEWSFVPVPSQRMAGVIKNYDTDKEEKEMDIKQVIMKACTNLSTEETSMLMKAFDEEAKAKEIDSLKAKVKEYEEENEELKKSIEETVLEKAKSEIYEGLSPVSDKAKEMADMAIEHMLVIGEDGQVGGVDEARKLLDTDYKFLFNCEDSGEVEVEEEKEAEIEGEGAKRATASFSMGVKSTVRNTVVKKYIPGIKVK